MSPTDSTDRFLTFLLYLILPAFASPTLFLLLSFHLPSFFFLSWFLFNNFRRSKERTPTTDWPGDEIVWGNQR